MKIVSGARRRKPGARALLCREASQTWRPRFAVSRGVANLALALCCVAGRRKPGGRALLCRGASQTWCSRFVVSRRITNLALALCFRCYQLGQTRDYAPAENVIARL